MSITHMYICSHARITFKLYFSSNFFTFIIKMSNSKKNKEQKQSKITSFISKVQTSKQPKLSYQYYEDDNYLFSEDFNFDNFETSTTISKNFNNEQDTDNNTVELKNSTYNRFAKENLK